MASNFKYCKTCGESEYAHFAGLATGHSFEPIVLNMDHGDYLRKSKLCVLATNPFGDDNKPVRLNQLYVVWFSKTLQNWKALVSTDAAAGCYWEVTYNGSSEETYVDTYKKEANLKVKDSYFNRVPDEPTYEDDED